MIFGTRILWDFPASSCHVTNMSSITPLTALRIYFLNSISSPSLPDQTLTSYHAYLASTIHLNIAIFVACLPFLKPFMESMSSGAFASTLKPMDSSYGGGSRFDTFMSGSYSKKPSLPKSSYMIESVTDSRVSQTRNVSNIEPPGLASTPQDDLDNSSSFHFGFTPGSQGNLGSLRLDKVTSFSHIGCVTPDRDSARSSIGSDKMIIKRTTAWQVQETYEYRQPAEYGEGISKMHHGNGPAPNWGARDGHSPV